MFLIGLLLASLALSACGEESEGSDALTEVKGAPTPPRIEMPTGPPPDEVIVEDIREGDGAELEMYRKFTANYVNFDYETGEEREKVWNPTPFTWDWGYEQLVDGLEIGLEGMRVGGLRELIVPSRLAYDDGARVYLVELLKVF